MNSPDDLETALLALGDTLDLPTPPPATTARAVRARLEDTAPTPSPTDAAPFARRILPRLLARPRWQWAVTAIALALTVFLGGTPQGRAAVVEILRVAGVELHVNEPVPALSGAPGPLPGERRVTLAEARKLVRFTVGVPARLGDPREVRVSDGGRVVSLLWPGIRLDEYDGTLGVVWDKQLGGPWPEDVTVGAVHGWWIPSKHGLQYLPSGGGSPVTYARLAGPTLIWQRAMTGLRLEGVPTAARAVEIADSTR